MKDFKQITKQVEALTTIKEILPFYKDMNNYYYQLAEDTAKELFETGLYWLNEVYTDKAIQQLKELLTKIANFDKLIILSYEERTEITTILSNLKNNIVNEKEIEKLTKLLRTTEGA